MSVSIASVAWLELILKEPVFTFLLGEKKKRCSNPVLKLVLGIFGGFLFGQYRLCNASAGRQVIATGFIGACWVKDPKEVKSATASTTSCLPVNYSGLHIHTWSDQEPSPPPPPSSSSLICLRIPPLTLSTKSAVRFPYKYGGLRWQLTGSKDRVLLNTGYDTC